MYDYGISILDDFLCFVYTAAWMVVHFTDRRDWKLAGLREVRGRVMSVCSAWLCSSWVVTGLSVNGWMIQLRGSQVSPEGLLTSLRLFREAQARLS